MTLDKIIPLAREIPRNYKMSSADFFPSKPSIDYVSACNTTDPQYEGSCAARASCNHIETMSRMAHKERSPFRTGKQLNAAKLYWEARKHWYPRNWQSDEGLPLRGALDVAILKGIVPSDTHVVEVDPTPVAIRDALDHGTMIQGHLVGDNWGNVDRKTGIIHGYVQQPVGGHATHLIGQSPRAASIYTVCQNSWPDWGRNGDGLFLMPWDVWFNGFQPVYDGPYQLRFGPMWVDWKIPEQWII